MKRIIICCIITAVIFVGGILALCHTNNTADNITEDLKLIETCWLKEDKEGAMEAARRMETCWKNFRKLHMLTVDNDHALEITMSAAKITDMLKRENDDLLTECAVMSELIRVYKDAQSPVIMNVL